jgi:GNAT superfamily N-acetyltransferase
MTVRPAFSIRPCQATDLPAVLELLGQLSEVTSPPQDLELAALQNVFAQMAEVPHVYLNLVADVNGQVAGFGSVIFYQTLFHRGGTALINELVVRRELRGEGIGSALVRAVVDAAAARGMDEVEVGTERTNEAARRFYDRCGFDQEYVLLGMELD